MLILGLLSLSGCTETKDPNVVWIVVDTLRADHTGFMGYEKNITPKLDVFAKQNIVFTQTISQAPWTKPSIATMFTSTYPSEHAALKGLGGNGDILKDELITIAEVLKENGYSTGGFQVNPHIRSEMNFDQGFDVYEDQLYRYDAKKVNEKVNSWLNKQESKYFLYIQYMDVHIPYFEHEGNDDLYGNKDMRLAGKTLREIENSDITDEDKEALEALYDGEIRHVDKFIGELLERFDENTIIIITSDHGEEFWEHGGFEHGHTVYDELIKVPLVIKVPGIKNKKVNSQVRLMDISPTILDVLKIRIPKQFKGKSLMSTIEGEDNRESFTEGILYGQEKKAYRNGKEKIIFNVKDEEYEFYDIKKDPGETKKLEEIKELKKKLEKFMERKGYDSERAELDEQTKKQLESLGYVT